MIEAGIARLSDPRFGMVLLSAVIALLMAAHWTPMALPAVMVIGLAVLRPQTIVRPVVWWGVAGLWFMALIVAQERMEDHVYLFAVWLVALASSLSTKGDDNFLDQVAWHARTLIGVTFTAAVAWKIYFGEFISGMALWVFVLLDSRFAPLATVVGLSDAEVEQGRLGLTDLLAGAIDTVSPEAASTVMWRIAAVAVFTLVLEAVIAVAHLLPDSNRLAVLRLPSLVLFAVVTYSVVPVLPFAALLALLAMTTARWRREALWAFPVIVVVPVIRLLMIN